MKLPVCYVCAAVGEGVFRTSISKFVFCETCAHRYPVAAGIAPMTTAAHVPVVTPPQDTFEISQAQYSRVMDGWSP